MAPGPKRKIPNKPGVTNWVQETGHLPSYIKRIAEHLHGQGMPVGRSIATAVNTVKRWAAGGTVRANGGHRVTAKTQAQAAKAFSQWKSQATRARSLTITGSPTVTLARSYVDVENLDAVGRVWDGGPVQQLTGQEQLDLTATEAWTAQARRTAAAKGQAMKGGASGGRFPIRDRRDVEKAIRAVGRAKGSHAAVRAHIMRRARALGASDLIPDSWKTGGSGKVRDLTVPVAPAGEVTPASVDLAVDLAWSDASRAAALEARRRKAGKPYVSSRQGRPTDRKHIVRRRKLSGEEIESMGTEALQARLDSGLAAFNEREQIRAAIATRKAGHRATQTEPGVSQSNTVAGTGAMTLENLNTLVASKKLSPETTRKLRAVIKRLRKQRGGRTTVGPAQIRTGRTAA